LKLLKLEFEPFGRILTLLCKSEKCRKTQQQCGHHIIVNGMRYIYIHLYSYSTDSVGLLFSYDQVQSFLGWFDLASKVPGGGYGKATVPSSSRHDIGPSARKMRPSNELGTVVPRHHE
jgi:hypothetical protein